MRTLQRQEVKKNYLVTTLGPANLFIPYSKFHSFVTLNVIQTGFNPKATQCIPVFKSRFRNVRVTTTISIGHFPFDNKLSFGIISRFKRKNSFKMSRYAIMSKTKRQFTKKFRKGRSNFEPGNEFTKNVSQFPSPSPSGICAQRGPLILVQGSV